MREVYNLAADMAGIGYAHMIRAVHANAVSRILYSSSACVSAADRQREADGGKRSLPQRFAARWRRRQASARPRRCDPTAGISVRAFAHSIVELLMSSVPLLTLAPRSHKLAHAAISRITASRVGGEL